MDIELQTFLEFYIVTERHPLDTRTSHVATHPHHYIRMDLHYLHI